MRENLKLESAIRECFPIASSVSAHSLSVVKSDEEIAKEKPPIKLRYGGKEIEIKNVDDVTTFVGLSTKKLFDYMLLLLTKYNNNSGDWLNNVVTFTLQDYFRIMGLKNTRQNRHKYFDIIREDLMRLGTLVITEGYRESYGLVDAQAIIKSGGEEATKTEVLKGVGCFKVDLKYELLKHLSKGKYIISFFSDLLKLVGQSENAYALAKRMLLHYGQNRTSSNRNKLKVRTLLHCCPETGDPDRRDHVRARFEKSLDVLASYSVDSDGVRVSPLIKWGYIYHGEYFTAQELHEKRVAYDDWEELNIHFELLGYTDKHWADREKLDSAHRLLTVEVLSAEDEEGSGHNRAE